MIVRAVLVGLVLSVGLTGRALGQLKGVRFEIKSVGDTSLGFSAGSERWIRRGIRGSAVDPKKRDVLVAQLRVVAVDRTGYVTALVTGQTTAVTVEHVVVLQQPSPAWYRRRAFWGGLVLGVALGAVTGAQY